MTARFMSDTPYAKAEQEMQQILGFQKEGIEWHFTSFNIVQRSVTVVYVPIKVKMEHVEKQMVGICLHERLLAGCVSFGELLEQLNKEIGVSPFVSRVDRLSVRMHPCFFMAGHKERFEDLWSMYDLVADEAAMCAALYLLSADKFLWGKSVFVIQPDIIRFKEIRIHGVDLNGYVLFHTAKDLYQGTKHISLSELVDPELVGDMTFELIIRAFLIRRYGSSVLKIERG